MLKKCYTDTNIFYHLYFKKIIIISFFSVSLKSLKSDIYIDFTQKISFLQKVFWEYLNFNKYMYICMYIHTYCGSPKTV